MIDRVRIAHCGDMAGLGLLWHDAVHKGAVGAYDAAQLQAWSPAPKSAAFMIERLSGQIILVAEDDEGLAGFFTLTPEGELDMAYVRPDRKGDGLAARLLAAIQDEARRRDLATLTVQASHIARKFFEKHGWALVQTQTVRPNGVEMQNHRMVLHLEAG
ncbi:GNAT family N-acetyltransferase [Oceanicaulis alexandrii]|uniref:GNAT family N-acetyltransferase n=1 Tax=Oceanicaulis alexandrii TaxID=153233 RepID=UPI0035CF339E